MTGTGVDQDRELLFRMMEGNVPSDIRQLLVCIRNRHEESMQAYNNADDETERRYHWERQLDLMKLVRLSPKRLKLCLEAAD